MGEGSPLDSGFTISGQLFEGGIRSRLQGFPDWVTGDPRQAHVLSLCALCDQLVQRWIDNNVDSGIPLLAWLSFPAPKCITYRATTRWVGGRWR